MTFTEKWGIIFHYFRFSPHFGLKTEDFVSSESIFPDYIHLISHSIIKTFKPFAIISAIFSRLWHVFVTRGEVYLDFSSPAKLVARAGGC